MFKKIILFIALQGLLLADFQHIDTQKAEELIKQGAPVIDIRTPGEWKEGVIPHSHKIMFFDEKGNYDVAKFMKSFTEVVKDKNQPFILVCRSASRTKVVGNFLSKDMGYTKTKDLKGGIMWGWNNLHKPIEK